MLPLSSVSYYSGFRDIIATKISEYISKIVDKIVVAAYNNNGGVDYAEYRQCNQRYHFNLAF